MYPRNPREALLLQLEAEAALYGLALDAFDEWAPDLVDAVLAGRRVDTSADALAAAEASWAGPLDEILVYGVGLVYLQRLDRAMSAHGTTPPAADPTAVPDPVPDTPRRARARATVARTLGVSEGALTAAETRAATYPVIRELQSEYLAAVHNRMVGTPDAVFREIAREIDKGLALGEHPSVMAERVQTFLGPETGDWEGRAMTVARTESAGAQSSATVDAAIMRAEIDGETVELVWEATLDGKTRPEHWAADGQRIALGAKFDVGGYDLAFPGDPNGPPELVINCRCAVYDLAPDEPLPSEMDRHTERGPGDATVRHRDGSQADEIERRARDGNIRARDDVDGIGRVAAAATADNEEDGQMDYRTFTDAAVALLGVQTDDGRMLADGIDLSFRTFPLPLMWTKQTSAGHDNAYTVGVIEAARIDGGRVLASGYLLNTAEADEAADQIEHGVTGPSVDLGAVDWIMTDGDGRELTEEAYWDAVESGNEPTIVQTITAATLMGVTLVATPAFGDTSIALNDERAARDETVAASLLAAAPVEPVHSAEMFADPGLDGPTALHMTDDGRIVGHLACFGTCHIGITDGCVTPPRSHTDYAHFHTSPPVLLDDGTRLAVGRLTVATGHAGARAGAKAAAAHYDNTGTCFALVRAGEDEHGIWISGVAAPDVSDEALRAGLSAPLSGDWRRIGGNLELVAALSVNTPGYPIIASGASDDNDEPLALVASIAPRGTVAEHRLTGVDVDALADAVVTRMASAEERRLLMADARETVAVATRAANRTLAREIVREVR